MTKYVNTIIKVAIHRETENPVFGEGNTFVSVEDDAAGPFLVIEQNDSYNTDRTLRMEYEELLAVTEAAKMLMHQLYVEAATMESNSVLPTEVKQEYYGDYQI